MGRARRVAIAVKTWSGEESVFVWNWAKKYFIQVRLSRGFRLNFSCIRAPE